MTTYTPGQKVLVTLDPMDDLSEDLGESFVGTYVEPTSNPEHGFPHRVEYVIGGITESHVFAEEEVSAA